MIKLLIGLYYVQYDPYIYTNNYRLNHLFKRSLITTLQTFYDHILNTAYIHFASKSGHCIGQNYLATTLVVIKKLKRILSKHSPFKLKAPRRLKSNKKNHDEIDCSVQIFFRLWRRI